ncbi:protein kinase family protein [Actinocorallia populi]|uniref:protein kinase family protein n=1 Tax=Actinocorallia populi TaxID=2079200 RepID=UPI000D090B81|nr:protein kinase family protein [Actinocorallia populi]
MSTSVIEPGTRLAGRYRLEEKVSEADGSTLWKAIDEILARAVAVRTFEPGFPRAAEVVTAARTASRLTDPRLTQVFDADNDGELAYVISEWVSGETLEEMIVSGGPLAPGRAARFVSEAAEALTTAHKAGMSHLCLTARHLVWTTGGTVKLTGLGVEAVLCGVNSTEPARLDALGLGQMLYAALTGHWPGGADESSLPPAPEQNGDHVPPRELREEVPAAVDEIVRRAMEIGAPEEPLTTPAEVAAALAKVPRTPLPLFAGLQSGPPPAVINRPQRAEPPAKTVPQPRPPAARPAAAPQPTAQLSQPPPPSTVSSPSTTAVSQAGQSINRPLVAAAAAVAALVIGIAAWQFTGGKKEANDDPGQGAQPTAPAPAPSATRLQITHAKGIFDLTGNGNPDSKVKPTAHFVKDKKPGTYFETDRYREPYATSFGNFLNGAGFVLDLGSSKQVSKVVLHSPPASAGAAFKVYVGDSDNRSLAPEFGSPTTLGTGTTEVSGTATGRYVIVWFTSSPPSGRVQVGEASVHGTE